MFKVEGVTGVYLGGDFISVTKAAGEDWHLLKPAVLGAIMEHYLSGDPAALEGARLVGGGKSAEDDPTVRQIKELIETRVRFKRLTENDIRFTKLWRKIREGDKHYNWQFNRAETAEEQVRLTRDYFEALEVESVAPAFGAAA